MTLLFSKTIPHLTLVDNKKFRASKLFRLNCRLHLSRKLMLNKTATLIDQANEIYV